MSSTTARFEKMVESWRSEVARRRKVTGVDPIADAIDYCAAQLEVEVKEAKAEDQYLSVAEYAALTGKTTATVRKWCRLGRIHAEKTVDGDYRIPKNPRQARAS